MTQEKANGRWRCLSVDSHASHVSRIFLQYCREHKIHVPCYIAHGTHIYQGLDVVCFSPLKTAFGQERDKHMRETGLSITKDTFAMIYGRAHLRVMTPELIKTAFRKTGLWPVDRSVITLDMMAPSRATSVKVFTPVEMSTPVRVIVELLVDAARPVNPAPEQDQEGGDVLEVEDSTENHQDTTLSQDTALIHTPNQQRRVRFALPELRSTDLAYLISDSPMKANRSLPDLQTFQLSPVKTAQTVILDVLEWEPGTRRESHLLEALQMQTARLALAKDQTTALQGQAVLQQLYANRVRTQLAAKEEKAAKKGKGRGKHLKDGLPRLLTGEAYFQHVVEHEEAMKEKEREKDARKKARESQAAEMILWEQEDQKRRERNEERTHTWKEALDRWEADRKVAKSQGVRLKEWDQQNPKPKARDPQFAPEPMIPKPKISKQTAPVEQQEEGGEEIDIDERDVSSEEDD